MKEQNSKIIYKSNDGQISFDVNIFAETVWLTQKQISLLFEKHRSVITKHISNIYKEGELNKKATCANFAQVQMEGGRELIRNIEHYNLDMILSVGYRVKSQKGIAFRLWANQILKQYMLNGYSINETRIRQIESSIDELVSSNRLIKEDVDGIKNLLVKLIERPIVIQNHNNINIANERLEDKIIELLDELIAQIKSDQQLKKQINQVKQDFEKSPQENNGKISKFLSDIADEKSSLHKKVKAAGVARQIIAELIKISSKFKDLL